MTLNYKTFLCGKIMKIQDVTRNMNPIFHLRLQVTNIIYFCGKIMKIQVVKTKMNPIFHLRLKATNITYFFKHHITQNTCVYESARKKIY